VRKTLRAAGPSYRETLETTSGVKMASETTYLA
jgi:hypothetical protein